ncbi:hypothetical protein C7S13_4533 [Burkholderia cepacia]|nr:hypothetical protein [Burkholderia cepacia]
MRVVACTERDVADVGFVRDAMKHRAIAIRQFRQAANGGAGCGSDDGLVFHVSFSCSRALAHIERPAFRQGSMIRMEYICTAKLIELNACDFHA